MNNFDIGITTFSLRYDFVESLVKSIRTLGVDNNIFLCINGEKDSNFSEEYRQNILTLCLNYTNVFPIFFVLDPPAVTYIPPVPPDNGLG